MQKIRCSGGFFVCSTKYARFLNKAKFNIMPITLLKYIVFGAVTGTALFGGIQQYPDAIQTPPYPEMTLSVHQKPDALDVWLEKLVALESMGNMRAVVLDVNGKYSYGCLQFQKETFKEFGVKYNIFSKEEIANLHELIFDCKLQKQLARIIIENEKDGWEHWYTSVVKRGLGDPPRQEDDVRSIPSHIVRLTR